MSGIEYRMISVSKIKEYHDLIASQQAEIAKRAPMEDKT